MFWYRHRFMKRASTYVAISCLLLAGNSLFAAVDYHMYAATPPMGWNSWDCFGTTVTEAQTKQQADFMAEKLKRHGWQYIVVDIQWYQPTATGHKYEPDAQLTMDDFGRLIPAPKKFPSATNGQGFKFLADYVHRRGLKFGIHMMRGIPRQAVRQNRPIQGTRYHAADIADTNSLCQWNPDMFGVDMSRPGAQAYYDSLMKLIASWGVDYIKMDDLSRPYHQAEIEAIRGAIDKTGRRIVFSTSPGATPLVAGTNVNRNANMWRVSDDFWDSWPALLEQFQRLHDWTPFRLKGAWPDADMLPLGIVDFKRQTHFTADEQVTLMTLWCIARSPLMLGADLTRLDQFTHLLLTNDEVLTVNQRSENNHQLFRTNSLIAWVADVPGSADKYLAIFNTQDGAADNSALGNAIVPVNLADLGFSGEVVVRDLWQRQNIGALSVEFAPEVPAHGARLFRILKPVAAHKRLRGQHAVLGPALHDYPFQPVSFTAVHLTDTFWAPRLETNRLTTIPYAFAKCEESGRMYNFERAAAVLRGEGIADRKPPGFPFDDTDPYKVIEGASYSLAVQSDAKMSAYLDKLIALIASAQEPDGYLYTTRTIDPQHPHDWSGTNRWVNEQDLSHELYNAGHLFEAAVAHYQATGKTNLLNAAIREANLLCTTFGPATNQLHYWPGHEIVEMGLAKLYRVTGNDHYLALAKYFIDVRGSRPGGDDYHQSRIPPVEQTTAIGHAVRAGYLYSGMADVAALTGDTNDVRAIDTIWENCVGKKLYLTGGIGARHDGEAFGDDYELPNFSAYNETCAAVANDYWNERLFLLHGDAKYVDVLERTLYNGLLAGVSLDGTKFYYPNPLESDGNYERSPWFGCACCPGNITRFLPSLPGYFYAQRDDCIFVNLFAGGTAAIKLSDGRTIKLTQETRYPWDGEVKITVAPEERSRFTIAVRIPGWARGEVVPGGLYEFLQGKSNDPATLKVNGNALPIKLDKGYVRLNRLWKDGDVIKLNFPMPVQPLLASDKVAADRGRIALQRGPIVYCAEWPDNPNGKVRNLILPRDQKFQAVFDQSLLNGVKTINGRAMADVRNEDGAMVKTEQPFKAIPYFAWANRGKGEMTVWLEDAGAGGLKP